MAARALGTAFKVAMFDENFSNRSRVKSSMVGFPWAWICQWAGVVGVVVVAGGRRWTG
jgi:hypothetical protein